ncbi:uncharacterized protein WM277_021743 [Molossus nigricans]
MRSMHQLLRVHLKMAQVLSAHVSLAKTSHAVTPELKRMWKNHPAIFLRVKRTKHIPHQQVPSAIPLTSGFDHCTLPPPPSGSSFIISSLDYYKPWAMEPESLFQIGMYGSRQLADPTISTS